MAILSPAPSSHSVPTIDSSVGASVHGDDEGGGEVEYRCSCFCWPDVPSVSRAQLRRLLRHAEDLAEEDDVRLREPTNPTVSAARAEAFSSASEELFRQARARGGGSQVPCPWFVHECCLSLSGVAERAPRGLGVGDLALLHWQRQWRELGCCPCAFYASHCERVSLSSLHGGPVSEVVRREEDRFDLCVYCCDRGEFLADVAAVCWPVAVCSCCPRPRPRLLDAAVRPRLPGLLAALGLGAFEGTGAEMCCPVGGRGDCGVLVDRGVATCVACTVTCLGTCTAAQVTRGRSLCPATAACRAFAWRSQRYRRHARARRNRPTSPSCLTCPSFAVVFLCDVIEGLCAGGLCLVRPPPTPSANHTLRRSTPFHASTPNLDLDLSLRSTASSAAIFADDDVGADDPFADCCDVTSAACGCDDFFPVMGGTGDPDAPDRMRLYKRAVVVAAANALDTAAAAPGRKEHVLIFLPPPAAPNAAAAFHRKLRTDKETPSDESPPKILRRVSELDDLFHIPLPPSSPSNAHERSSIWSPRQRTKDEIDDDDEDDFQDDMDIDSLPSWAVP